MKNVNLVKNGNKDSMTEKETKIMQSAPQKLLKEYVQSQHFTSTADIMQAMKEMFRDVIQTVMEVEMDEELGRNAASVPSRKTAKIRAGTTATATRKRPSRRSLARSKSRFPETATDRMSRRSSASTTGTPTAWRRRSWRFTPAE